MTDFDARMTELRAAFAAAAEVERARLTAASDRAEIRRIAHSLAGRAGIFGFAKIGRDAQALEHAVDDDASDAELRRLLAALMDSLSAGK